MKKNRFFLAEFTDFLVSGSLLFMFGAWLASLNITGAFGITLYHWILWISLVLFGTFYSLYRSLRRTIWHLWLLCLLLGGFYFTLFHFHPGPKDISNWAQQRSAQIEGVLIQPMPKTNRWLVQAKTVNHQPVTGQFVLHLPYQKTSLSHAEPGSPVDVTGQIVIPYGKRYSADFNYRTYLLQQHISALVFAKTVSTSPQQEFSPWLTVLRYTQRLQHHITRHFQTHLHSPESDILAGIVLGEHGVGLDQETKDHFIQSGLIHILAASGLNVGLIGAFFLALGKWCRLPFRLNLAIAMGGVAIYCLMTGLPPSVQRAGLMMELALLLKLIRRELTPITLLCITGLLLTMINPWIVAMVGFQLSFLSTFGLLAMVPPLQKELGYYITHWAAGLILVPLVAQIWVAPTLIYAFNQFHPWSLLANWVALPCAAIITYLGFILGGLSLIIPGVTGWLLEQSTVLVTCLKNIAILFSQLPMANWAVASPPPLTVLALYGILLLWAFWLNHPIRLTTPTLMKAVSLCLVMALLPPALGKWQHHQANELHLLPHRQGTVTQILRIRNGLVLVNANPQEAYWDRDLIRYCRQQGIKQIDLLLITNPTLRDLSPLKRLISQSFPIRQIMVPSFIHPQAQTDLVWIGKQQKVSIIPMTSTHQVWGDMIRIQAYALPPYETLQYMTFDNHLCVLNHWGQTSLSSSAMKRYGEHCILVQDQVGSTLPAIKLIHEKAHHPITVQQVLRFENTQVTLIHRTD